MNKQNISSEISENTYSQIKQVLLQARASVLTTVNTAMVQAYWHVGKLIVEAQGGEERAAYIGAKEDVIWQESELESALISHLEEFLLELGRGFAFMGRQKRITIDGQHFYPDLVFYNVLTRSYIIIDLKMKRVDYSDVGQMQLYVNYYNREICQPDDNPTIGIILCAEKNDTVIEYTLGDRKDIGVFSAKYDLIMPTKEELSREIELTRQKFKLINS